MARGGTRPGAGRPRTTRAVVYFRAREDLHGPLAAYQDARALDSLPAAAYDALLNPRRWAEHLERWREKSTWPV